MRNLFGRISLAAGVVCIVVSVVVALAAYAVGHSASATYQSSGVIRIGVISEQGISDPVVLGANDLTAQYAQLVGQTAVTDHVAAALHVPAATLQGEITGATVSAQNLLQVTANGSSTNTAESRARAATIATVAYLRRLAAADASAYLGSIKHGLGAVISSTGTIARSSPVVSAKAQSLSQGVRDAASNEPTFEVVSMPTSASESSPKPKLYALVALIVALLVTFRVAYLTSRTPS